MKTIKTPTWPIKIYDLTDIPDLFSEDQSKPSSRIQDLRYSLAVTNGNDVQPYVWLREGTNCTYDPNGRITSKSVDVSCEAGTGTTYSDLFSKQTFGQDPFIAQLPAQFNTGLIRQFLPRVNSSLTYVVVDTAEFPQDCDQSAGSFYAEYSGQYNLTQLYESYRGYSVQVCMPGNLRENPWRATRDRQDIAELLYLKVAINSSGAGSHNITVFKVEANSTAGYFELPNYLNGGSVGRLIDNDLNSHCDEHCIDQGRDIL